MNLQGLSSLKFDLICKCCVILLLEKWDIGRSREGRKSLKGRLNDLLLHIPSHFLFSIFHSWQLKSFGAELNKMKSYFIKESKILAHNEKAVLYSKLLQSAQVMCHKDAGV